MHVILWLTDLEIKIMEKYQPVGGKFTFSPRLMFVAENAGYPTYLFCPCLLLELPNCQTHGHS